MSEPSAPETASPIPPLAEAPAPHLRRVLGLSDLVFYGVVLIQPVGVMGLFGVATRMSHGHMATSILIAMGAMMITAANYGRMAALFPSAGSAYTYVGRGLNPHLGFLTGWAMVLDYLVIPIVNVVYGAIAANQLYPRTDAGLMIWIQIIALGMTIVNACGIRWTARANQLLLAAMCAVMVAFIVAATRFLLLTRGWAGLWSLAPFYDPGTFDFKSVCTATSFAAAAYIGFDGITTLAEDSLEPKRTVPLATVLVCLIVGVTGVIQVYLAQLAMPEGQSFENVETVFMDIAARVAGPWLSTTILALMAVACFGSGLTSQVGAARLLYGMGRDNVLPRAIFGRLDARHAPTLNVLLVGVIALTGAYVLDYERATLLINFGAFLAFMGVNSATIRVFWFQPPPGHRRRWLTDLALPSLGLLFCFWIWKSLPWLAQIVGGIWFAVGIVYAAIQTRGFQRRPVMLDFSEE